MLEISIPYPKQMEKLDFLIVAVSLIGVHVMSGMDTSTFGALDAGVLAATVGMWCAYGAVKLKGSHDD